MDEQSGNVADETAEMMSETVAHQNEELRKRRSTRIMQAVPLAVTGVDALGRPFTERTSTLIINCHGCRYQSKHYVLKNMWVTLEVPHPEGGQPPREVRGRVAWIQRPRPVRQLFQVALELETPGNTWGIAFPPPDTRSWLRCLQKRRTLRKFTCLSRNSNPPPRLLKTICASSLLQQAQRMPRCNWRGTWRASWPTRNNKFKRQHAR